MNYRRLAKNATRANVHAALAKLYTVRRRLMTQGMSASAG